MDMPSLIKKSGSDVWFICFGQDRLKSSGETDWRKDRKQLKTGDAEAQLDRTVDDRVEEIPLQLRDMPGGVSGRDRIWRSPGCWPTQERRGCVQENWITPELTRARKSWRQGQRERFIYVTLSSSMPLRSIAEPNRDSSPSLRCFRADRWNWTARMPVASRLSNGPSTGDLDRSSRSG